MSFKKISIHEREYPLLLKQIPNPPQELFYLGDISILQKSCISIVGTRKCSDYGEFATEKIVEEMAIADLAIVSGLAKGIDSIAHRSALKNNLPTIAVLGTGISNIYPVENRELAEQIIKKGLLISEFESQPPRKEAFPRRNRIISGLSLATIVIEAPEKSGALITASFALDQNRDVFTIPADFDRQTCLGNLKLLQKSMAYPISSGKEIIEMINNPTRQINFKMPYSRATSVFSSPCYSPSRSASNPSSGPKINFKLNDFEKTILSAFPLRRSLTIEKIQQKTSLKFEEILGAISTLEIHGLIIFDHGKYYRCT